MALAWPLPSGASRVTTRSASLTLPGLHFNYMASHARPYNQPGRGRLADRWRLTKQSSAVICITHSCRYCMATPTKGNADSWLAPWRLHRTQLNLKSNYEVRKIIFFTFQYFLSFWALFNVGPIPRFLEQPSVSTITASLWAKGRIVSARFQSLLACRATFWNLIRVPCLITSNSPLM